jgi:alkaline phosphatase
MISVEAFNKITLSIALAGGLLLAQIPGMAMAEVPATPEKPAAKNIIIMISDGCGYNHIDAASLYQYGKTGVQPYENFPVKYGMSTYSSGSYNPQLAWSDFRYVTKNTTDSAAAATAMSTGVKTYNSAIGVGRNKQPLKNVLERAEEVGKATGVVTSVQFSQATPAGFAAHNRSRNDYSGIAREMLQKSSADVIMGAGHPLFDNDGKRTSKTNYNYVGGISTWQGLLDGSLQVADADGDGEADPWNLIQERKDFQALMSGDTPKRVCGVAQVAATLQQSRSGNGKADPYTAPFNESVPMLEEMTRGALNVLDNDKDGFFLMIEGGAIDWAGHANQSGRLIEEEIEFNKSVKAVVDWVERHSNWGETLLIVTGDHETGYLTGPGSGKKAASQPVWNTLQNNGANKLPGMQWNSDSHTNSLIPFFAKGDAAELFRSYADEKDPVRGLYIDNTEVAKLIFNIM